MSGLGIGVWVALVFSLRPLLALRRVSPLQALRRDADALERQRLKDLPSHLVNAALVASVILLCIARSDGWRRGVLVAGGSYILTRFGLADLEAGYGSGLDAIAATVRGAVEAGAVGLNIEDGIDHGVDVTDRLERVGVSGVAGRGLARLRQLQLVEQNLLQLLG